MNSMLQLFFMSYATMYCESKTVSALARQLLADVHPPHVARVTGVLREAIQLNIKSKYQPLDIQPDKSDQY